MHILALDFMNAAHRARSGFMLGDNPVVYNFFRGLKSTISEMSPTRVYVALEGRPVARREKLVEYKANRVVPEDDPRYAELQKFFKQKETIVELLRTYFPVSVVRHPTSEADDTIANLISNSTSAVPWTVVTTDTDFIQLLQQHSNVQLYNPVQKSYVAAPTEYDYCTWKSLRGDSSDNIPGIPKCGDKTAAKLASNPELLKEFLEKPGHSDIFTRNYELIRFTEWTDEERSKMTSSVPKKDWDAVRQVFDGMGFQSITKDGAWQKFTDSFEHLWGVQ